MSSQQKILIIGGGYAGIAAAKALNKAYKKTEEVEITLVDKNRFHTLMTELHEIAGDRVPQESVMISYERIFAGTKVNVVHDGITGIDFDDQVATGLVDEYPYDYILIATGGEPADFGVPGIKEHTLTLWSLDDALAIHSRLENNFRQAALEPNEEKRRRFMSVCVAGAGFTGIELVGELLEFLPSLCKKYNLNEDGIQITNVEAMGNILNMIPEKLQNKAAAYMRKKGVEIRTDAPIVKADKNAFHFKDGSFIEAGALIWTCGVQANCFYGCLDLKEGRAGRKEADKYMRSPGHDNVYLAGDGLWFIDEDKPVPQIVEAAEQTAETAAHNIMVSVNAALGKKSMKLKEFHGNYHGFMVSIGGKYAVSHTGGISMSGFPAMAIKHLVNMYYQGGITGINGIWAYLKHEILNIRNKRSLIGGFAAWKTPNYWLVPLRMYLGVMWLLEGINKIKDGWLDRANDFVSVAVDSVAAASSAAADTVAAASGTAEEAASAFGPALLDAPWGLYTWLSIHTVNHIPFFFQSGIVVFEILIGLAFIGGAFTWLAAAASFVFSIMLIIGAMTGASIFWYMAAALAMLGGAGRSFGLDYWIMPWLKKWWNGTKLAKRTHLYVGEPVMRNRKLR